MTAPKPVRQKPSRKSLPAEPIRQFRELLDNAFNRRDTEGRRWADARWGVYAFYDYDGEPIYVGQTNERLRIRVRRHLTNQRSDAVAMRVLDVLEVAEIELWPMWNLETASRSDKAARAQLDALEYSAYLQALELSRFGATLNEKVPPVLKPVSLPASLRVSLVSPENQSVNEHPDIRIARRAETISRLAAVVFERGEVSEGLRRVLVVQAIRLTYLAAARLAAAEGRSIPDASAIDTNSLLGELAST